MTGDGIFLDGYPLILECGGQTVQWLEQWLAQEWAVEAPPNSHADPRLGPTGDGESAARLPTPNYPPRPHIGINQLYWPIGATRWAQGYFLADEQSVDYFRAQATGMSGTERKMTSQAVSASLCGKLPIAVAMHFGSQRTANRFTSLPPFVRR